MIKEAIEKIVSKQDLTYDEAYTVMNEIMNGETTQVQNAAYLAALSTKSTKAETIDEISGSAMAMRDHALKVEHAMDVLDIVGTGGDHAHSINISTTAAMIIAAAGVKVATATAPLPRSAVPPTASKRSASTSTSRPLKSSRSSRRLASASCSPRSITPR